MNGKQATIFLIVSLLLVFIVGAPTYAQVVDSDGDGVPDEIEDSVPGILGVIGDGDGDGTPDSQQPGVASFLSFTGPYLTLYTARPNLVLRDVAAIESPDGNPLSPQASQAAPYGFISFDLIGTDLYEDRYFTVALIIHEDGHGLAAIDRLVRYGSPFCEHDFSDPIYYVLDPFILTQPDVAILIPLNLKDGAPLDPTIPFDQRDDPACPRTGIIPFIGAPAIESFLDSDEDEVIVFTDNCPAISNSEQTDSDGDGIGDLCDNCRAVDNPLQVDTDGNGIGNMCEEKSKAETTVYSYIGKRFWRFFRDYDIWEIEGKAGQSIVASVRSESEKGGTGKRLNLILFGKTRGARLLRIDRSMLDPENKVEAVIPKDGIYKLTVIGELKMLESLRATRSVGKWWK